MVRDEGEECGVVRSEGGQLQYHSDSRTNERAFASMSELVCCPSTSCEHIHRLVQTISTPRASAFTTSYNHIYHLI